MLPATGSMRPHPLRPRDGHIHPPDVRQEAHARLALGGPDAGQDDDVQLLALEAVHGLDHHLRKHRGRLTPGSCSLLLAGGFIAGGEANGSFKQPFWQTRPTHPVEKTLSDSAPGRPVDGGWAETGRCLGNCLNQEACCVHRTQPQTLLAAAGPARR